MEGKLHGLKKGGGLPILNLLNVAPMVVKNGDLPWQNP